MVRAPTLKARKARVPSLTLTVTLFEVSKGCHYVKNVELVKAVIALGSLLLYDLILVLLAVTFTWYRYQCLVPGTSMSD